jgi:serine/threonine-protein kinase HipA
MNIDILINGQPVGTLSHDPQLQRFSFSYTGEWLSREDRFALCPQLPLSPLDAETPEAHSAAVRRFFENLLPEGQALDDAAAAHQVSKSNLEAMLIAVGRETAGAISIKTDQPNLADKDQLRPLPVSEISERIRHRPHQPFSVWDGKVRLSIAGFQDKIAAYRNNGDWFLVEGPSYASTYILKPEPVSDLMRGMTSNEFFCMRLAARVKVPAAEVELIHVPEPVLVIKRFDRKLADHGVERLHIIDGCQALGLPVSYKYERPYGNNPDVQHVRDGASLPKLFDLVDRATPTPADQRLRLLRWTILQILIGNTDAHAKNLSFFSTAAGLILSPAYDLVSGTAFQSNTIDKTYAMAIGDAFSPDEISPYEWANFATECKLPLKLVSKELERMSSLVLKSIEEVMREVLSVGAERDHLALVASSIRTECQRQLAFAPEIRKIPPTLL